VNLGGCRCWAVSDLYPLGVAVLNDSLVQPGSSAPLGIYLQRLWDLRHFAWAHARSSVRASTSSSILGYLWLLLEPALLITVLFIVFGVITEVTRGIDNYLAFLAVGQIAFMHHRRGILEAGSALRRRGPMLRTFAFPRAILPVSAVLKAFLSHSVALAAMLMAVLATGEAPRLTWLLLPVLAVSQAVLNLGGGLIIARFLALTDDLNRLLTYLFRLGLYLSGVIFPVEPYVRDFEHGGLWLKLMVLNPFYVFIELYRWAVLSSEPAESTLVVISAFVWTICTISIGMWTFRRTESRYTGYGKVVPHE